MFFIFPGSKTKTDICPYPKLDLGSNVFNDRFFYREKCLRKEMVTKVDYQSLMKHKEKCFFITKFLREKTGKSFHSTDETFHKALIDLEKNSLPLLERGFVQLFQAHKGSTDH